jgi:uncharacterized membrane protein
MEFSKRKIITNSWNTMKKHLGLWVFIMLLIIGLNLLLGKIQEELLEKITPQTVLFTISAYLFQAGLNLGMLRIALNINNKNETSLKDLVGSFHMLIPYMLATIIFLAIILLLASPGTVLLLMFISSDWDTIATLEWLNSGTMFIVTLLIIVPAVYVSMRLQFYDYFLIDNECSILDSIIKSAKITKGFVGELFILGAILSIIVLISIIPLGAGLLISIPLGIMVNTHVYQKLNKQALKTD